MLCNKMEGINLRDTTIFNMKKLRTIMLRLNKGKETGRHFCRSVKDI